MSQKGVEFLWMWVLTRDYLPNIVSLCWSVLDFWKIKFEKSRLMNLIFTACVASKNQVRNRLKIKFIKLDFSNLIFQKSSTDQQGVKKFKWENTVRRKFEYDFFHITNAKKSCQITSQRQVIWRVFGHFRSHIIHIVKSYNYADLTTFKKNRQIVVKCVHDSLFNNLFNIVVFNNGRWSHISDDNSF